MEFKGAPEEFFIKEFWKKRGRWWSLKYCFRNLPFGRIRRVQKRFFKTIFRRKEGGLRCHFFRNLPFGGIWGSPEEFSLNVGIGDDHPGHDEVEEEHWVSRQCFPPVR